jgi:endoglucanase
MFGKENSNCPGNSKANSRAKQIKVLIIVFLLALIIGGQLSVIKAAGPYSASEVPLGRTFPALTRAEQKLNLCQKNLKRELPQVGINWQRETRLLSLTVNSRLKSLFDQLSERFFQRFLEKASPRLIIVNPKPEPTPLPVSLTPTPTYAAPPTPTMNPATPTPTLVPTTVPTVTLTVVPTVVPTATSTPLLPTATPTQVPAPASGYSVSGAVIRKNGQPLALNGVNWFGFETANNVVHGLWSRNYKEMIAQMKAAGFNSLRIPFCPNTVANGGVSGIDYSQNPDLQGLKSLEILDKIVEELDRQGMTFVLDHHRPDCNAISELPASGDYSESAWIADLVAMTNRYKKYDNFLGVDLKNEPHGAATWGTGDSTDWKLSAEKAGKAVLEADPNLLVFVEGIQNNPSCSDNAIAHWWGGNLEPQACYPINLPREKLVLSPHVYGPDVFPQDYFNAPDFPNNLPAIWEKHFGFLAGQYALAMGEWGGRYQGKDAVWQNALVDFLVKKGICNSFYWSWNPNSGDTGGILQDDWRTLRQDKVELLGRFASQCRQ